MNTLLLASSRMVYPTDLRLVFEAFGGRQREFNWLLTDLELNHYPPGLPYGSDDRSLDTRWLSGAEFSQVVEEYDIQFIWGVLTGFRVGVAIDVATLATYPYADGNGALWKPEVSLQHPLAEVEIVCWDSTATLLLSRDDDLTERFRRFFPEAVDLNEYNREIASSRDNADRLRAC